jgi:hypothetical protein
MTKGGSWRETDSEKEEPNIWLSKPVIARANEQMINEQALGHADPTPLLEPCSCFSGQPTVTRVF